MKQFWNKEIKFFHLVYVVTICILIITFFFIILLAPKISSEAFQNFSFASTVVSIVLAVISIIFSMWYSRDINRSFNNFKDLKTDIQDEVSRMANVVLNNTHESEITVSVGHDSINVPMLIRNAKRYLFFHAAYYPKYGIDEHGEIIKEVMRENNHLQLKAIFTDSKLDWGTEFATILRPHFDKQKYESVKNESKKLFEELKYIYSENRVQIIDSNKLPMYPIIMIDNTLVVGFYSHSRFIAPQGIWLTIKNSRIIYMYEQLILHGKEKNETFDFTNEEKAIFRFIEEIFTNIPEKKCCIY